MVLDVLMFVALMIAQFGFDANCTAGFLACLMVFLFSIISVFIGIAGTYIGKIHTQVKERPIYIAKEILTYEENL